MSGKTYGVWRCPVCGTTKNKNETSIRNPLNRYNHLRWHEKMHPGTVRRKSIMDRNSQAYCGYVIIGMLLTQRSQDMDHVLSGKMMATSCEGAPDLPYVSGLEADYLEIDGKPVMITIKPSASG